MQDAVIPAVPKEGLEFKPASGMRRYLLALAGAIMLGTSLVLAAFALVCSDGRAKHDFFSEITKDGDPDWYRDYGGRRIPQIQDQDIFYSNVVGRYRRQKGLISCFSDRHLSAMRSIGRR